MTNFEKWKTNLKPENLLFYSYGNADPFVSIFLHEEEYCCKYCPARNKCGSDTSKSCRESWLDWANEEAEENGEER